MCLIRKTTYTFNTLQSILKVNVVPFTLHLVLKFALPCLAWLPDKIEWVGGRDGVCVIASLALLNLQTKVTTLHL